VRLALLVLAALLAANAKALEVEGGYSHENLDKGKPDWKSVYLEAAHDLAKHQTVYGWVREVERFDFRDSEIAAGYYHPFNERWTGQVETSHSADHKVLPATSLFAALSWQPVQGWLVSGGWRRNEYATTESRVLSAGLERYFGSYRAFYALHNGKPQDAPSASAQRFGIDYYYGERSRVGAGLTWGREVENVGPPTGLITSDVRAIGVYGRHWMTSAWALTWELGTHEQGELYRRTGGRLGLRRQF